MQIAGFIVGLFLLFLCIRTALSRSDGDWK